MAAAASRSPDFPGMFAGEDDDGDGGQPLGRIGMMAPSLLSPPAAAAPTQQQQQQHQPQWSQEETREFIRIRAELERDFTAAKRNKNLWEIVSARMRERGYRRTPEQCKCKWKNLLNRYKVALSHVVPGRGGARAHAIFS